LVWKGFYVVWDRDRVTLLYTAFLDDQRQMDSMKYLFADVMI